MDIVLNHKFSYGMVDLAIIFSFGIFVVLPLLVGYSFLIFGLWDYFLKRAWNVLWKGMDEENRYEYTTITFKTKKW